MSGLRAGMRGLAAALVVGLLAGCAPVQVVKEAQGTGQKKLYKASFQQVWAAIPRAIEPTSQVCRSSPPSSASWPTVLAGQEP